jgi:hypothetical protein
LIGSTSGAATLDDVTRIRGRGLITLLAEQTGMSAAQVREGHRTPCLRLHQ